MEAATFPTETDFQPFPYAVVDRHAKEAPTHPALYYVSPDPNNKVEIVTYGALSEVTERAAVFFGEKLNLVKGERVLIQLPRGIAWFQVILSLLRLGVVPIPCTTLLVSKELKYRAETSKCTTFIGSPSAVAKFSQVHAACKLVRNVIVVAGDPAVDNENQSPIGSNVIRWEEELHKIPKGSKWRGPRPTSRDIGVIYFTSGTTGAPKKVIHTQLHPFAHQLTGRWYDLKSDSLLWNIGDLGWAKAGYTTFGGLYFRATLFISGLSIQTPQSTLYILHSHPITNICFPPTVYRALTTDNALDILAEYPPKALRVCNGAGEPLNSETIKVWKDRTGLSIREGYGQTETVLLVGNFASEKLKPGSMGIPVPGVEIEVIGPDGSILPRGSSNIGEIAIEVGKSRVREWGILTRGYEREEGKINNKEIEASDGKRWYSTGDKAWKDDDGYLHFVGRDDDIITSAGYRIGPFDVESTLKEHPLVVESAAVASPDAYRGSIVKAFVMLSQEARQRLKSGQVKEHELKKELTEFVRPILTYKYPREIEFVDSLPLTVSGKVRRVELRLLEESRKSKAKM